MSNAVAMLVDRDKIREPAKRSCCPFRKYSMKPPWTASGKFLVQGARFRGNGMQPTHQDLEKVVLMGHTSHGQTSLLNVASECARLAEARYPMSQRNPQTQCRSWRLVRRVSTRTGADLLSCGFGNGSRMQQPPFFESAAGLKLTRLIRHPVQSRGLLSLCHVPSTSI